LAESRSPEVRKAGEEILSDPCIRLELALIKLHERSSTERQREEAAAEIAKWAPECPDWLERMRRRSYLEPTIAGGQTEALWFPLLAAVLGVKVEGNRTTSSPTEIAARVRRDPCGVLEVLNIPHDVSGRPESVVMSYLNAKKALHELCELTKKEKQSEEDKAAIDKQVEAATSALVDYIPFAR
jgi:hypothetical protein